MAFLFGGGGGGMGQQRPMMGQQMPQRFSSNLSGGPPDRNPGFGTAGNMQQAQGGPGASMWGGQRPQQGMNFSAGGQGWQRMPNWDAARAYMQSGGQQPQTQRFSSNLSGGPPDQSPGFGTAGNTQSAQGYAGQQQQRGPGQSMLGSFLGRGMR